MAKPITGKTTTSVWKQKRKSADSYLWERQTVYSLETRKIKKLSRKLLGKIPARPTDGKNSTHQSQTQRDEDTVTQSSTRSRAVASLLPRWLGEQSGISEDLNSWMGEGSAKKGAASAQFWLANQDDRLQRMRKWHFPHPTLYPDQFPKTLTISCSNISN